MGLCRKRRDCPCRILVGWAFLSGLACGWVSLVILNGRGQESYSRSFFSAIVLDGIFVFVGDAGGSE